jgi:hypothetical protein
MQHLQRACQGHVGYSKQETELKQKIIADGTATLFRNEFKYTTETKFSNILLERKYLKM